MRLPLEEVAIVIVIAVFGFAACEAIESLYEIYETERLNDEHLRDLRRVCDR